MIIIIKTFLNICQVFPYRNEGTMRRSWRLGTSAHGITHTQCHVGASDRKYALQAVLPDIFVSYFDSLFAVIKSNKPQKTVSQRKLTNTRHRSTKHEGEAAKERMLGQLPCNFWRIINSRIDS